MNSIEGNCIIVDRATLLNSRLTPLNLYKLGIARVSCLRGQKIEIALKLSTKLGCALVPHIEGCRTYRYIVMKNKTLSFM